MPVLVPLVMSWKSAGFWYRMFITCCGLVLLSAGWPVRARPWSAIARSADHCGAPALVPPTSIQS